MKLSYILDNLHLVSRNKAWLSSDLPLTMKLFYYPRIVLSYLELLMLRKKSIRYLDTDFNFDNPATPLNLQTYPKEVKDMLDYLKSSPRHILSIGGNIGQFSITTSYFKPKVNIDVFEPNPEVFELLRSNTKGKRKIRIYRYALARGKSLPFYFEPGRSGAGSFVAANSSDRADRLKQIKVECTDNIASITGRRSYDLVKIDVEGYELHVLEIIKNIDFRYLFIELSGVARSKDYLHSEIMQLMKKEWGDFDILSVTESLMPQIALDMLVDFKPD